ncbi:MAG TPA: hypothetical protein VHQ90_00980 [Thermoanaerobaculia bacterium]|nr:hypothetical protein [Thermoanaerobaculia bacterium]
MPVPRWLRLAARRLILIVLAGSLARAAAGAVAAAPPATAGERESARVHEMIAATRAEVARFQGAGAATGWEGSAASRQLAALWQYGRDHHGEEAGALATVESLRLLARLHRYSELTAKVETMWPEEAAWAPVMQVLLEWAAASGDFSYFIDKAQWLITASEDASLRARLWFTLGRIYREQGRTDAADAAYKSSAREAAGTPLAADAAGAIYELHHLNPGQAAPTFAVQQLGGGVLSLDKLRGKVVVLEFWGST